MNGLTGGDKGKPRRDFNAAAYFFHFQMMIDDQHLTQGILGPSFEIFGVVVVRAELLMHLRPGNKRLLFCLVDAMAAVGKPCVKIEGHG